MIQYPKSFIVTVAIAVIGTSCSRSETKTATTAEAERPIVEAATLGSHAADLEIDKLAVTSPAELRATAVAHVDDPDPNVHAAAVYALSLSVTTDDQAAVTTLNRALDSGTTIERLHAASGLVSIGHKGAVPDLIELLGSDEEVPGTDPPMQVWQLARGAFLDHFDQDIGLANASTLEDARKAQADWRQWWDDNGNALKWDPDIRRFSP